MQALRVPGRPDHREHLADDVVDGNLSPAGVAAYPSFIAQARAALKPTGREVWVTVRGENYISVIDAKTFMEKTRIVTPSGPGMQIFSPDGKYGYICSSFNPETDVVSVADHKISDRAELRDRRQSRARDAVGAAHGGRAARER